MKLMVAMTLTELLVAVVIVGVLASFALPTFAKATHQQQCRNARAVLLTIYTGERRYFLDNQTYRQVPPPGTADEWRLINVEDPNVASVPVEFSVPSAGAAGFTAQANIGPLSGSPMSINQARVLTAGECDGLL